MNLSKDKVLKMEKKLIIIGIDGATFDFIKPLTEKGKLPNIARLMKNGVYNEMKSTLPPLTALAWPSFFTGVNPGKHGIFDFTYRDKNNQVSLNNFNNIKTKTLWDYSHEQGLKSVVINVPMTYPPKNYENNVIISGILSPENKPFCNNKKIEDDLKREFGNFIYYDGINQRFGSFGGLKKSISNKKFIMQKDKQVRDISLYLLDNINPDILITVFMSVDQVKHIMWGYRDKNNLFYDEFGDCVEKTYVEVDKHVGKILEQHEDSDVIIISDHGWGNIDHVVYVNSMLRKNNLLQYKEGVDKEVYINWQDRIRNKYDHKKEKSGVMNMDSFIRFLNKDGVKRYFKKIPFKYHLYTMFSVLSKEGIKKPGFKVDFDHSKAWLTSRPSFSIHINSKDPYEHKEIVKNIKKEFHNLRCEECGKTLITEIFEKGELYWGNNIENAPDIIIIPNKYDTISTSASKNVGTTVHHLEKISGWHKLNGIFIASGPNIKSSSINPMIYDIVPTVLSYLNIPIPNSIDGKTLDILKTSNPKYEEINIYNKLNRINNI